MPIKDRNLKPGTHLVGRYHKEPYACEVVEGEGGKLRYRLQDGREFKSPSAAGMAITGHACDGWVFWSVETATAAPAAQPVENSPVATQPASESAESAEIQQVIKSGETVTMDAWEGAHGRKSLFRTPNQKGVPEGQTRWYCHECAKSFLAPAGHTPEACPQGHRAG